jgi:hypothetical protein
MHMVLVEVQLSVAHLHTGPYEWALMIQRNTHNEGKEGLTYRVAFIFMPPTDKNVWIKTIVSCYNFWTCPSSDILQNRKEHDVVFFVCLECQIIDKVQKKPIILSVICYHQNPLDCLCLFLWWILFRRSFNGCFLLLAQSAIYAFYNENLPFF